jgi:hypothetical protein
LVNFPRFGIFPQEKSGKPEKIGLFLQRSSGIKKYRHLWWPYELELYFSPNNYKTLISNIITAL